MLQFLKDLFFGKKVEKVISTAKPAPAPDPAPVKVVKEETVQAETLKKVSKPRNRTNRGPKKPK